MSYFSYKDQALYVEDKSVAELAKEVGTPFYCYSTKAIVEAYKQYLESFSGLNIGVNFALRVNHNLAILRQLHLLGAGMECMSAGEINRALKAGIEGKHILFGGMVKSEEEMLFALKNGVGMFTVESEAELEHLNQVACAAGIKASIALRVGLELDNRNNKRVTISRYDTKYGIEWSKVRSVYQHVKTHCKHLQIRGIGTHLGSQFLEAIPFQLASKRLATLIEMLVADGHTIDWIDLGGGLENTYAENGLKGVKEFADILAKVFGGLPCKLLLSPGQVILSDTAILVTKAMLVKRHPQRNVMVVDASLCDFLHPDLSGIQHELLSVTMPKKNAKERVDVVGRILGNSEIISKKHILAKLEQGDLYAFSAVGAYAQAIESLLQPSENKTPAVLVHQANATVISKRENVVDRAIVGEVMPKWL